MAIYGEDATLLPSSSFVAGGSSINADDALVGRVTPAPKSAKFKERLVSLDGVRGLTVAIMILVDNLGEWFPHINHSPWDDVTLADFVMPFFLFMVGCSMSLAFKRTMVTKPSTFIGALNWLFKNPTGKNLSKKVFLRTIKLFVLGLLTQGADFPSPGANGFDLSTIRVPGILQRIAWAYGVVSLIVLVVPHSPPGSAGFKSGYFRVFRAHWMQWLTAATFFFIYLAIILGAHVPTWSFHYSFKLENSSTVSVNVTVDCDTHGDLTPACSAARLVDHALLGGYEHLYSSGEFARLPECSSCSPSDCPRPLPMHYCTLENKSLCPPKLFSNNCTGGACAEPWCKGQLDPEGVLSSFPAVLTTFIGFHFGRVIQYFPLDAAGHGGHRARFMQWLPMSFVLIAVGVIIEVAGWKPNKQIWTPSYVFIMAGTNGLVLATFYALLDYTAWQPTLMQKSKVTIVLRPLVWVGMNTIFIYLLSPANGLMEQIQDYFWWKSPENTLLATSYRHIFCGHTYAEYALPNGKMSEHVSQDTCNAAPGCRWERDVHCGTGMFKHRFESDSMMVWILGRIAFWCAVAGILYRYKWFWAL